MRREKIFSLITGTKLDFFYFINKESNCFLLIEKDKNKKKG